MHYVAKAEHLKSSFLFFSSQSLNAVALVLLHNVHRLSCEIPQDLTKTCLYNFDPLKPDFYIVKLGFAGVFFLFLLET